MGLLRRKPYLLHIGFWKNGLSCGSGDTARNQAGSGGFLTTKRFLGGARSRDLSLLCPRSRPGNFHGAALPGPGRRSELFFRAEGDAVLANTQQTTREADPVVGAGLAVIVLPISLAGRIKQRHPSAWNIQRAHLLKQMTEVGAKHFMIVAYSPHHSLHHEWVYNEADIDNTKVVWARSMDTRQNSIDKFL